MNHNTPWQLWIDTGGTNVLIERKGLGIALL